jgi:uncharacterized protein YbcV (DUF1398 family)
MFTVEQIKQAHAKVRSGADFPAYIQAIKQLGVIGYETMVTDSRNRYFGNAGFTAEAAPMYAPLFIAAATNTDLFRERLKMHQAGKTDYRTFCQDCADCGVEKWVVSLDAMTCTYFDQQGNEVLVEKVPG